MLVPARGWWRLLTFVVVVALLGLGTAGTASASSHRSTATSKGGVKPSRELVRGIAPDAPADAVIKGLVYNQKGRLLDDINVEAVSTQDLNAGPVASALTYEAGPDSHGAYELSVPAGSYLVRFSSPVDATRRVFQTLYYGGGAGTPVTITAQDTVSLDPVTLTREQGLPVTGSVQDAAGAPLADVDVELRQFFADGSSRGVDWAVTDAAGGYTLPAAHPGRSYSVLAYGRWSNSGDDLGLVNTWLGDTPLESAATKVSLAQGDAFKDVPAIRMASPVTIHGTVTNSSSDSPGWMSAELFGDDGSGHLEYLDNVEVNDDGSFSFADVAPDGVYTVMAEDSDTIEDVYLGDTVDAASALRVSVPAGNSSLDVGTIALGEHVGQMTGSVLDTDGDPASGYDYLIWVKQPNGSFQVRRGYGDYENPVNVDLGLGHTYTVEARPNGADRGTFLGGATTPEDAQTFTLDADHSQVQVDPITIDSGTGRKLFGFVTAKEGGAPVAGARVKLWWTCDNCGWYVDQSTHTDADGRYAFTHLDPATTYVVSAEKPADDLARQFSGSGSTPENAGDHFTTPDSEDEPWVQQGDVILGASTGTIRGVVSAPGGSVNDGYVTVRLWNVVDLSNGILALDPVDNTDADDDGSYGFTNVAPGAYAVSVNYSDELPTPQFAGLTWYGGSRPTTLDDQGVLKLTGDPVVADVTLDRGVLVSGTVTGENGRALPNVYVNASTKNADGSSEWVDARSTDDNGRYQLRVSAGSRLLLHLNRLGYQTVDDMQTSTVREVGDQDTTIDVAMTPDWSSLPTGATAPAEYCLQNDRGSWMNGWGQGVPFAGHQLELWGNGLITVADRRRGGAPADPLAATSRVPAIAVLFGGGPAWSYPDVLWGRSDDGSTLCALWENREDGAYFTAELTKNADHGIHVTYRYDALPTDGDWVTGYTAGDGTHSAPVSLDKPTDLPSEQSFDFDGFDKAAAPVVRSWPTLTGDDLTPGSALTVDPGTWTEDGQPASDVELDYHWHHVTGTPDGASYTLTDGDLGRYIYVTVRAWAPGRHFSETIRTGSRHVPGAPAGTNASAPVLTPDPAQPGDTLTVDNGEWSVTDGTVDDLTFDYRWKRDGHRISGAREASYVVQPGDVDHHITVAVLASRAGHSTARATSNEVTVNDLPQVARTTAPQVSGEPKVGETLQTTSGTWDAGADEVSLSYRWVVGYQERTADTSDGSALTLQKADQGQYVTLYVTASAAHHRDRTWSTTLGPVAKQDASTGTMTVDVVSGDAETPVSGAWVTACESDTWTCLPGTLTDGQGIFSGVAISGATYRIQVYPSDESLKQYDGTFTMPASGDATTKVTLEAPTPAPTNVSIPTSYRDIGGTPVVYWQEDQQFDVTGCAGVTDPTYTVTFSDGSASRTGSLTPAPLEGGLARYSALIPAFYPAHGDTTITTNVPADCEAGTEPTKVEVYIDPSGVVTDQYGRPIDGATVTLLRSEAAGGPYGKVKDGSTVMSEANRHNPSITGTDGFFRWDVTEGWYRVRASAPGCTEVTSDPMQVLPARVDLLLELTCTAAAPSVAPTIVGSPAVGSTLTTDTAGWGDTFGVTVQWLRDGTPISQATGRSYAVTAADAGHQLSVRQTAQRPDYTPDQGRGTPVSFTPTSATSSPVDVPVVTTGGGGGGGGGTTQPSVVTATTAPVLTGAGTVGSTLTVTDPTWNLPGVTTTRQWYRDTTAIEGEHGSTHEVIADDAGHVITVLFTGTLAGLTDGTTSSNGITATEADAPTATAPMLHGTAKTGQTLTVDEPAWSQPGVESSYQWMRAGQPVDGATGPAYTLSPQDVGQEITAIVTGKLAGHEDATVTTASVIGALGDAAVATTAPAITGGHRVGSVLRADTGAWPDGVALGVTWLRDGIGMHKGPTYRLRGADAGHRISAAVTAMREGYTDGSATSSAVKVRKLTSTVVAHLRGQRVAAGHRGLLRIVVEAAHQARPTGVLQIRDRGHLLRSVPLRAGDHGRRAVRLPQLSSGKHRLKVTYGGSGQVAGSTSKVEVVRVR